MHLFDKGVDRRNTACIKWDFQEADYGRNGLLPFSIADADYATCPAILDAIKARVDNGVIGYTDLNNDYFSAIAGWAQRRHGWEIAHNWIVPTGGIVPAMCNAIEALTDKDATIIVQPPVYDPFYSIINASGCKIAKNDLIREGCDYSIDFDGLEEICKKGAAMLLFCNPHNPVCRVWTRDEVRKVAEICAKYGVIVISDEIHWDLVLGGHVHTSVGQFADLLPNKLIVCTSCSKTFNIAGLETSNLIIPGDEIRGKYQDYLYARYLFCPNTLGLVAAQAACTYGDEWVDEQLAYLTENAACVLKFMEEHLPKVKVAKPEGTYLLWFDMTAYGLTSDELIKRIAEEGAGLNSGHHYGENYDGFVRMNIACPRSQLEAGLACIEKALNKI